VREIGSEDAASQVAFLTFLDRVPRATLRDRTRRWRTKWVYGPLFLAVLWGISLLITALLANSF
jgi:hypothetical protein